MIRWRYILPGGRSPFGHPHRRRRPLRKRFDYGAGKNAAIRLGYLSVALFMVVLLEVVKVTTHQ